MSSKRYKLACAPIGPSETDQSGHQSSMGALCVAKGSTFLHRPQGYKTFSMLNSTQHKISTAHRK